MEKVKEIRNKFLDFLYKYRYVIAFVVLVLAVLFKLHGSSLDLWNSIFTTGVKDTPLWGSPRFIRSDEWAVTTPFIFSQKYNHFNVFTNIIRGTNTEVFSLYGLPVFSILAIFRPYHLGYLLFGLSYGLSFFWVLRIISLLLVTFELVMLITNSNKRLAFVAAMMITFAPIVQWWFATNGTVELFVFGQLAIILLDKYMKSTSLKQRCLYLFFMIICVGGYIFILYPAYQIPMFYVFLALAIYTIINNRKDFKFSYKDLISVVIALIIFVLLMGYAFYIAKNTILATLNTVYPGNRIETGGKGLRKYITYIDDIFLAYKEEGLQKPTSEEAAMFSLFPLGIILSIYYMVKNKKKDPLTIALLVPYIILGLFTMVGFPKIISKITLLSYSTTARTILALGYIDVLFLVRSMSLETHNYKTSKAIILSLVLSLIMVGICKLYNGEYDGRILISILFMMCMWLFFFTLKYDSKYGKYAFTLGIVGVMFLAGAKVNPITRDIKMITDSPIIKAAESINNEDEGIWLTEAMDFPCANYLVMAGCPTINSTNSYPNLELMKKFDKDGKYEKIYNRYAHVYIELVPNENMISEKFVQVAPDIFRLYITPNDLKDLNIKYIFTVRVMENDENQTFDLIYNENNYHIYKVNYIK